VNEVPEVLQRLLFEYDGAPNRRTLLRIAKANPEVAEYLASQPDVAPDLLEQLSEFTAPEIIARSPNAPVWLLARVGRHAPEALLENPALLLLSLESPDKFQEMLGSLVEEILLKLPDPPPALFRIEFLKTHRSRVLALAHLKIPKETVIELAGSEDYHARNNAAQHPLLPDVFRRIILLPELGYEYSQYPRLQSGAFLLTLTKEEWEMLITGPNWFRHLISTAPTTPPDVLARLANTSSLSVQQTIAANRRTPPEALRDLSYSFDGGIQSAIAHNPSTPPDVLERYATQSTMIFYLPGNPSLPLEVGLKMLENAPKTTSDTTYLGSILERPDLPEEKMREYSTHKKKEWRAMLARNPKLPNDLLTRLAVDKTLEVRMSVASRKDLPESALEKLSQDKAPKVRASAALNPSLSLALMEKLADDPETLVRISLAKNHNLNRVVMSKLKKDESDTVRNELFKTHAKALRIVNK
jgi:hypothetical protein